MLPFLAAPTAGFHIAEFALKNIPVGTGTAEGAMPLQEVVRGFECLKLMCAGRHGEVGWT